MPSPTHKTPPAADDAAMAALSSAGKALQSMDARMAAGLGGRGDRGVTAAAALEAARRLRRDADELCAHLAEIALGEGASPSSLSWPEP